MLNTAFFFKSTSLFRVYVNRFVIFCNPCVIALVIGGQFCAVPFCKFNLNSSGDVQVVSDSAGQSCSSSVAEWCSVLLASSSELAWRADVWNRRIRSLNLWDTSLGVLFPSSDEMA